MTASPPPSTSGFDRRRSERVPMPARGGAVSVVGARLVNVSIHGMLIESMVPLERDSLMNFRLVIGGDKVDVEARVACCSLLSTGARKIYGLGLEFTAIPESAGHRLAEILATVGGPEKSS